MSIRSRVLLCLISVVAAGALAACGGSSSVTGASDGAAAGVPSATIAGTVITSGGSAAAAGGFSTSSTSGGIRVSVSGTSLETTTDDDGRFTLSGVTPGEKVELRFEGPGVDAVLEVEGLTAGQTVTITVSLSGSAASMLPSSGELEIRGPVESVGANTLIVGGQSVVINDSTELLGRQNQPIPFSDIVVGAFVEVEGWPQSDGSILAKKVKLEDDDGDGGGGDQNEVEFRGLVESAGSNRLVVGGRTVVVNDATELLGRQNQSIPLSDIVVGSFVEVEGWPQSDGSIFAKKVKLEDDDAAEAQEVEFLGSIQSLSPLTVAGTRVSTDGSTRILDDDNNAIGLSDLAVGMRVEVEGWPQSDGSVLAKKIKIED